MFDIGSGELLLILIAVLVFFGPKKMPELARSVGRGVREFKRAQREFTDQINQAFTEEEGRQRGNVPRRSTHRVEAPPVELRAEPSLPSPLVVPAIPDAAGESPGTAVDAPPTDDPDANSEATISAPEQSMAAAEAGDANSEDEVSDAARTSPAPAAATEPPPPSSPPTEPPARTVRRGDERRERENREI